MRGCASAILRGGFEVARDRAGARSDLSGRDAGRWRRRLTRWRGRAPWAEVLRRRQGADGDRRAGRAGAAGRRARCSAAARAIAESRGWSATTGTGSTCCTARRRGSAGSISASCREPGGRDVAGILAGCRSGEIEVLYLLGADEIDLADYRLGLRDLPGPSRRPRRGAAPMSCCRAPPIPKRTAPTSTPRGGCSSAAAPCSRPARRARTGRSCARCRARSAGRCRSTSLRELRRQHARGASGLGRDRRGDPGGVGQLSARPGRSIAAPFVYPIADFYRTDPISRASPTMAALQRAVRGAAPDAQPRTGTHG